MKSLDVESLQTGIRTTTSDIEKLTDQLQTIEQSVLNFTSLDDELKGQGGNAIRSFYQDCHLPFLEYFQDSLQEFGDVMTQMKNALDSFESNNSGIVKEEYLENEVKDGFNKVERTTIELTDDANSIIESVQDLVSIDKIDESEVIESVQQGKDKVNDVVEELHALDESQVQALEPVLDRVRTMRQYITDLNTKFQRADLSVASYDAKVIKNMNAYNEIQSHLSDKKSATIQEVLKQTNGLFQASTLSLGKAKKKDNLFVSGLKTAGNTLKGGFMGGVDIVWDTAAGAYQMVRHPIQTYQSLEYMVLHPIETGKYIGAAISESYNRDMVNGDAESRAHWVTYTLGTILGTKGAGNALKSTKVGTNVSKAARESVQTVTNRAANIQMPNLFPYGPQHQLAPVGPVPYNVVDGVNLRDQMMMFAKHFTDNKKTKLKPNITYRTGEFNYLYKTDELGRIKEFTTDNLQLTQRENRLPHKSNTPGKQPGDHAGHLAGDRFGGSPELDNLVSQLSSVNLSQYKILENKWDKAIQAGKNVKVKVNIQYDGTNTRPSRFQIKYYIDGESYNSLIKN